MGYADLSTLHTPIGGARPPAAYGRQIEANFDFLASPPSVRVNRSTDQTGIATNTNTPVLFPNEDYDNGAHHSTSTDTSRLTAAIAGKYHIKGGVAWNNAATGVRALILMLNGVTRLDGDYDDASAAAHFVYLHVDADYHLAAGDWVELVAWHNSGGAETLKAADGLPHFSMRWVGL